MTQDSESVDWFEVGFFAGVAFLVLTLIVSILGVALAAGGVGGLAFVVVMLVVSVAIGYSVEAGYIG
jgi:hypothetical protein